MMDEPNSNPMLDENERRLIRGAAEAPSHEFEQRLTRVVLSEIAELGHGSGARPARRWRRGVAVAVAASVAFAFGLIWHHRSRPSDARPTPVRPTTVVQDVGSVVPVYGVVSLGNGTPEDSLTEARRIHAGEWIRTHTGSLAKVLLEDDSEVAVRPRTEVQLSRKPDGDHVVLRRGHISIVAAKQPAGRSLTIQTPGSQIEVLGTKLDVRVAQTIAGRKKTFVTVSSGRVALESAGRRVQVLPNMEGIVEEGQAPITRSLTAEVNEMVRLMALGRRLAAEAKATPGGPSIIEFNGDATATVWTVMDIKNETQETLRCYDLQCGSKQSAVKVYTLEGASLPIQQNESRLQIDLSACPVAPEEAISLVVRMSDVTGVLEDRKSGIFEFNAPGGNEGVLSVFQFRLPAGADIEEVSPKPIEVRTELSRLVVTVAADSRPPTRIR
ncbi:MAG: FecR domain-containing protein [Phycisphaerae bacterium]|nr:FecR domain-containing protein [Phycisphaerae bacterium]